MLLLPLLASWVHLTTAWQLPAWQLRAPCERQLAVRAVAVATAEGGGNYAVGTGEWPALERRPAPKQPVRGDSSKRSSSGKRSANRRGGGSGRGRGRSGRGSPVVDSVLRKLNRLDSSATLEEVDAVLKGKRLSARDFTTLLAALKVKRAWRLALRVGECMTVRSAAVAAEAAMAGHEPATTGMPNRAHYQVMLSACAASGQALATETLASQMVSAGMPMDTPALGTRILAHERAGEWARTVELLDELDGMEDPSADAPAGAGSRAPPSTEPRAFAYASAIRAHEAAGQLDAALGLFDRMIERGVSPDTHCYCAALGACRRGKLADRALELLRAAAEADSAARPNGAMYTLAMAACNAAERWETCLELFDERRKVPEAPIDSYAYSVAMGACAQGKAVERAKSLLDEMEADETCAGNSFAWNNAMVTCTRAGDPAAALELYDRMRAGACALTDHSVAAALAACRAVSDWQRAQAAFDGAKSARSPMCYTALLDNLADGGQWALVLRYFEAMRKAGVPPTARAYERAIEACDREDPDRALILFAEMRASGL